VARVPIDRFAAVAVRRGFVSRRQLESVLRELGLENARDRQKLIAALVKRNDLTSAQVDQILQILRGADLWCPGCKEVRFVEHFDPQSEYPCSSCRTPLRRVDRLDGRSNLRIDDVFNEIEDETATVRLSRWKVIRRLGRGGMGRVYLARHRQLGKLAAVKVLPADLAEDESFIKLFVREARALARLKHANIVEIYDIDKEAGVHFMVMEFVEGCSLKELLDQSGLVSPKVAINIAADVARALAHAHENGFVHRDVKPGNILLGRSGEVKLTDFGLVKEVAPDSCTWTDALLGTPHYMAPEQAKGRPTDARSDLYSLGATLYVMLSGTTPFVGTDTVTVLLKVCNDDAPELTLLNPAVPKELSQLVKRLMAKTPADRPPSARSVYRELDRIAGNNTRATSKRSRAVQ